MYKLSLLAIAYLAGSSTALPADPSTTLKRAPLSTLFDRVGSISKPSTASGSSSASIPPKTQLEILNAFRNGTNQPAIRTNTTTVDDLFVQMRQLSSNPAAMINLLAGDSCQGPTLRNALLKLSAQVLVMNSQQASGFKIQSAVNQFKQIQTNDAVIQGGFVSAEWIGLSYSCLERSCLEQMRNVSVLRNSGFEVLDTGLDENKYLTWFITKQEKTRTISLTLRGTAASAKNLNTKEMIRDMEVEPSQFSGFGDMAKRFGYCPDLQAAIQGTANDQLFFHKGFMKQFDMYDDGIRSAIMRITKLYPTYSWEIHGHSLGAAHGYLAAASFFGTTSPYHNLLKRIYLHGMPRVGSESFVSHIGNCISGSKIVRVTNKNDIVARIPRGFSPITTKGSTLIYVERDRMKSTNSVQKCVFDGKRDCEGLISDVCTEWNVLDHFWCGGIPLFGFFPKNFVRVNGK